MATFVLVHGAWGGAHTFHLVRPLLAAAGHAVFTPSLTGIGERAHLTGPHVDLATHVTDVVNHLWYEDLRDVVLLGYSYGGAVVTAAVEHVADRIRHLVYLDAFVPRDGDSIVSMNGGRPPAMLEPGADWLVPPSPRDYDDEAEAAYMTPRRVPHPRGCFIEPVRVTTPLEDRPFGRTYIRASADVPDAPGSAVFAACAAQAASSPAWSYHEIATNHMVASNRPRELADLLLALV